MIEANYPEINVDELMQNIRVEVTKHHDFSPSREARLSDESKARAVTFRYIETLLRDAESYSDVPSKFPDKFNRFPFSISKLQKIFLKLYGFLFKKQRVVNSSLIQVLRESVALNRQLIDQVNGLQEQLSNMSDRITPTEEHLRDVGVHLNVADRQRQELADRLTSTEEHLRAVGSHLTVADQQRQELALRLTATEQQRQELATHLSVTDERYSINDSYLKNELAQQKRLITMFLEEAKQRLPEPFSQAQIQTFVNETQHSLDALYVAFEDRFRGSRELIFERLKVYLPLIEEAKIGTRESPILDVGCGRGEWLELLRESGYIARGLDINRVALDQCRARKLEVIEEDVISYLKTLPDSSLGAVTGFHIIEHLPFEVLVNLFDETLRVLKPGGLAIFETPNPQNVLVGSCDFYTDLTHRNPLPSSTMKFLAASRGLGRVQILNVNPSHLARVEDDSDLAKRFNEYFYGYLDYAVVGFKL